MHVIFSSSLKYIMSLSRPVYSLLGIYFEQLFNHPVRTKSITASALAASANYTSQRISGHKHINRRSIMAYALFGLIFGGSVPHYFYQGIERLFHQDDKFRKFFQFILERLIYAPFYQVLSLYFLSRFEMNSHQTAMQNLKKLYWPLLKSNWKYLSLAVFFNMYYVPHMFRAITMSLVSFIWVVYIAYKRKSFYDKQSGANK